MTIINHRENTHLMEEQSSATADQRPHGTTNRQTDLLELEATPVKRGSPEDHRLHEARVLAAELAESRRALPEVKLGDLLEHLSVIICRSHGGHEPLGLPRITTNTHQTRGVAL